MANKLAFLNNSGVGIVDMKTGELTEVNPSQMNIGLGDS